MEKSWKSMIFFALFFVILSAEAAQIATQNGSIVFQIDSTSDLLVQTIADDGTPTTDGLHLVNSDDLDARETRIMDQVIALMNSMTSQPLLDLQSTVFALQAQLAATQANVTLLQTVRGLLSSSYVISHVC